MGTRSTAKKQGARSRLRKPKPVSARARNKKKTPQSVSLHMIRKVRAKKAHKQTGIEATVEGWLIEAGAEYKSEYAISRTHVDFYLPDSKTIIEVCGCHWHGCRSCSKDGELSKQQLRWRRRDGRRYTFFRNAGYNLVLVWEHEIEGDPEKARKKVLKHGSTPR